ncbi:MAG: hypothetical protein E7675_01120 [Ruminococcaceae bacterium]|nr:hypothetical protein [Oscillospiraceae bacterium]
MKNKKALDILNLVNDEYILAANPENITKTKTQKSYKRSRMSAAISVTACFLILVFSFVLVHTNVSRPYAKIARLLNSNDYAGSYGSLSPDPGAPDAIGPNDKNTSDGKYEEITDNQVNGVIEADLIKRSDEYIYYMHHPIFLYGNTPTLCIYSIDGENSEMVGKYTVTERYERSDGSNMVIKGFYLSEDCTRVTVILSYYYNHKEYNHFDNTELISLDVSDPKNIKELNRITVLGYYLDSRLVDGDILLFNGYDIGGRYDLNNEKTFVPHIDHGEGFEIIPAKDIIVSDFTTYRNYTVVTRINEKDFDIKDTVAYYSTNSSFFYVSENNIYILRTYADYNQELLEEDNIQSFFSKQVTEISRLSYANDKLTPKGSIVIDGSIGNQYWLDEYNGILRAVTSTGEYTYKEGLTTSADLYCIDINKMKIAASVTQFAPKGESVQSVRFNKDRAYVCTALVISFIDPVFFFDLSDIENITYTDTGDIEGYSSSLVNFGDDLCLGIGVGNSKSTFKVEIYQKGEYIVKSVCSYEIENSNFPTDYKAYLIDRENKLIGFGITVRDPNVPESSSELYLLLQYDGEKLELIKSIDIKGEPNTKRAVLIDGYLYVFGNHFKVEKL